MDAETKRSRAIENLNQILRELERDEKFRPGHGALVAGGLGESFNATLDALADEIGADVVSRYHIDRRQFIKADKRAGIPVDSVPRSAILLPVRKILSSLNPS